MSMDVSIRDVLSILAKKWWILFLCLILGGILGTTFSFVYVKNTYVAKASLFVNDSSANSSQSGSDVVSSKNLVPVYIAVLSSTTFYNQIHNDTGLYSVDAIRGMVSFTQITTGTSPTPFISVSVTGGNQANVLKIATSIVNNAPAQISAVVDTTSHVAVVDQPAAKLQSGMGHTQYGLLGAFILLILAGIIMVLVDVFDFRIKNEADIENHYNIPLLGGVPDIKNL